MFDFNNIEDFGRHIEMSVPNYRGLVDVAKAVSLEYLPNNGEMWDLGCSSGLLLNEIASASDAKLIGCDVVDMGYSKQYDFKQMDLIDILLDHDTPNVISCLFTLQFLNPFDRNIAVNAIREHVQNGATFIVAEKTHLKCPRINAAVFRQHMRGKLDNFSADEILQKDLDLAGSMFPLSKQEMDHELRKIGEAEQIWQSYNFKAWAINKI